MHACRGFHAGTSALHVNDLLVKVLVSYLLGSIVGSLWIGRLRGGVDIRKLGSGNAGGTSALRTQGKSFALWVLIIDIGKGWIAVRLIAPLLLPGIEPPPFYVATWEPALCGIAAAPKHCADLIQAAERALKGARSAGGHQAQFVSIASSATRIRYMPEDRRSGGPQVGARVRQDQRLPRVVICASTNRPRR